MQAHLSWAAARALAAAGARVRRAGWTDRFVFRTAGGLHWLADYSETFARVVRASDFGREEFLALDWTDADPDQNHCIGIEDDTYQAGGIVSVSGGTPAVPGRTLAWGTTYTRAIGEIVGASVDGTPKNLATITLTMTRGSEVRTFTGAATGVGDDTYLGFDGASIVLSEGFPGPVTAIRSWPLPWPGEAGVTFSFSKRGGISGAVESLGAPATSGDPAPAIALAQNYAPRTVDNPFLSAVEVTLSGSVTDTLLLDGVEVRSGAAFEPLKFHLPSGASFTVAARSARRDFPFYVGYDLAAAFRT